MQCSPGTLEHAGARSFLRDPIDRAGSVYRHIAEDKTEPSSAIATSRSFRGNIEWALEAEDGGNVVRNDQTIHLSEAPFRHPHIYSAQATEADFQQARHLLESWPAVGIVRRFAEPMRWFDQAYGHTFPYLFTIEEHRNRTNCDFISDEAEWHRAKEELGPRLFARLVDANGFDTELYQCALRRLREAVG